MFGLFFLYSCSCSYLSVIKVLSCSFWLSDRFSSAEPFQFISNVSEFFRGHAVSLSRRDLFGFLLGGTDTQVEPTAALSTCQYSLSSRSSEPHRQTTWVGSNDADSAFAFVRRRVKRYQPPQLLAAGLINTATTGSVVCQGESVRQDLPTGQRRTSVPLYMCGLEQVARSATRRCLGEDPRRCRSIDAKDAPRRCPPPEARTRAAPNS